MASVALPFKHLTVIGLGLIGGSLAMAARECFPEWRIRGVDPSAESLQYALKYGVIDQAALTLPTDWERDHLIVIACHLTPALQVLNALAAQFNASGAPQNVLVTDIGSCKQKIAALGQAVLPGQFIAGHPMAGKEFSGIAHATPLLFAGKSYLLCPHAQTPEPALETLKAFVASLGGVPRLIDAERHDRYMAYVSHLPQLYAVLLTRLLYANEPGHLVAYHGAGLDDQLRLAASPYAMWGDILSQNAEHLSEALSQLRDIIDQAIPALRQTPGPQAELSQWFADANRLHQQFHQFRVSQGGR